MTVLVPKDLGLFEVHLLASLACDSTSRGAPIAAQCRFPPARFVVMSEGGSHDRPRPRTEETMRVMMIAKATKSSEAGLRAEIGGASR